MFAEAREWLAYARENRQVAALSRDSGLFNPSLQNAQQAVEKALKAMGLASGMPLKKTHSIGMGDGHEIITFFLLAPGTSSRS